MRLSLFLGSLPVWCFLAALRLSAPPAPSLGYMNSWFLCFSPLWLRCTAPPSSLTSTGLLLPGRYACPSGFALQRARASESFAHAGTPGEYLCHPPWIAALQPAALLQPCHQSRCNSMHYSLASDSRSYNCSSSAKQTHRK